MQYNGVKVTITNPGARLSPAKVKAFADCIARELLQETVHAPQREDATGADNPSAKVVDRPAQLQEVARGIPHAEGVSKGVRGASKATCKRCCGISMSWDSSAWERHVPAPCISTTHGQPRSCSWHLCGTGCVILRSPSPPARQNVCRPCLLTGGRPKGFPPR